jgi:hypothetical protein
MFFAAHGMGSGTHARAVAGTEVRGAGVPRIRRLELVSAAPLGEMRAFYGETLGLPVLDATAGHVTIQAGETRIRFLGPPADGTRPFYHFAFNIPPGKVIAAHRWQTARTPLLPIPPHLRDPDYPDDVVNYRHWNAHSIFFFDPAGNVVEYIARHDLQADAPGDFGSADILYASEIAFVVDDVAAMASTLRDVAGVADYKAAPSEQFGALGDDDGLLLVMQRGRVISFDSPEKKAVSVFPTVAAVRGPRSAQFAASEFPYALEVET